MVVVFPTSRKQGLEIDMLRSVSFVQPKEVIISFRDLGVIMNSIIGLVDPKAS